MRFKIGEDLIIYGERYAALTINFNHDKYILCYRYGWMKDSGIVDEYLEEITQLSSSVCQFKVDVGLNGICQFYYAKQDNQWIKITRNFAAGKGKWVVPKLLFLPQL